ncbi:MAG: tRNA pseudouridine(55) synthase TruB [Acidimicrobiia bacterium]
MAEGLLVIDKPSGPTSHDIVAKVRRATGVKRVGHAGTLDPLATGVVVIGIGRATRLLRYVQESHKEYIAGIRFGIATDTLDADGREISRRPMPLTAGQVAGALSGFRGNIQQTPPMVSAIQVGGRRLHEMARAGEEIERQPRPVEVFSVEVVGFEGGEFPLAKIAVECSKGTYVRVLADDIAKVLGGRAHVESLRRTRVGSFGLDLALTVEDLDRWESSLLPLVAAVGPMPRLVVDDDQRQRTTHGRTLEAVGMEGPIAVVDPAGGLVAVYVAADGVARAEVVIS